MPPKKDKKADADKVEVALESTCFALHPEHSWVPGVVKTWDGFQGSVAVDTKPPETLQKVTYDRIFEVDEEIMKEEEDDLLKLSVLHDCTLLSCLRVRFMKNIVYTKIGSIVVALNPFNFSIPWYKDEAMKNYLAEGDTIQQNIPHSWAVAHNTYYEMMNDGYDQTIIVSGESGAGKTEASKIVMKYLGEVSTLRGTDAEKTEAIQVRQRMLRSNPILEAFGNAKTVRNDNSSRFGKFMRIKFNRAGFLCGADIVKYLLEKSRIVAAAQDERLYHSFYQLLKGKDRDKYGLSDISQYKTVNSGKCVNINGVDDAEYYVACCDAMIQCGLTQDEVDAVWKLVGGVLTLLNLEMTPDGEGTAIPQKYASILTDVAKLWDIDAEELRKELLTTTMVVNKEKTVKILSVIKAYDARDSLSKAVYGGVFTWLVHRINQTIDTTDSNNWIGLLDIFGFEDFEVNSLEQLCINLTNEALQNHYNEHIFSRDMEECRAEGISVEKVEFPDNTPCLTMITAKGGILALLDEECSLGKGTDYGFLEKITQKFQGKSPFFDRKKLAKSSFIVHHYAGSVSYEVDGFLSKNRDSLKEAFKVILQKSSIPLVTEVLTQGAEDAESKMTVGGFFKNQLRTLMDTINATNPHWIRCIKTNPQKVPKKFHGSSVMKQLTSSGVVGTVQIRKAGYPIRLAFPDFTRRYAIIVSEKYDSLDEQATAIIHKVKFGDEDGQIGKTKVFLRMHAYQILENRKKEILCEYSSTIATHIRVLLARMNAIKCYRIYRFRQIQAAARALSSQRKKEEFLYEMNKERILQIWKEVLDTQKQEANFRREIFSNECDQLCEIMNNIQECTWTLKENWWREKPEIDRKMQELVLTEEAALRREFETQFNESIGKLFQENKRSFSEALSKQKAREERERLEEEERIRQEQERLRKEAEERELEEKRAAEARQKERKRLAVHYWNLKMEEKKKVEQEKEIELQDKRKWIKEAVYNGYHRDCLIKTDVTKRSGFSNQKGGESSPTRGVAHGIISGGAGSGILSTLHKTPTKNKTSQDAGGKVITPSRGIGNWKPSHTPTQTRERLLQGRLQPAKNTSLDLVRKLQTLKSVKTASLFATPHYDLDSIQNPANPNNPNWEPPEEGLMILPDGTVVDLTATSEQDEEDHE